MCQNKEILFTILHNNWDPVFKTCQLFYSKSQYFYPESAEFFSNFEHPHIEWQWMVGFKVFDKMIVKYLYFAVFSCNSWTFSIKFDNSVWAGIRYKFSIYKHWTCSKRELASLVLILGCQQIFCPGLVTFTFMNTLSCHICSKLVIFHFEKL